MKRPAPEYRAWKRKGTVLENAKKGQLASFGAATLAWNDAEFALYVLVAVLLRLPDEVWLDVIKRINGLVGLLELARLSADKFNLPPEPAATFKHTLDTFGLLKKWRDAAVHSRIAHSKLGLGERIGSQAAIDQVLLTKPALDGLYHRLTFLYEELWDLIGAFSAIRSAPKNQRARLLVRAKSQLAQEALKWFAQAREHQNQRRSLSPMPSFPDERQAPPRKEAHLKSPH
jgi:hypothetical protein